MENRSSRKTAFPSVVSNASIGPSPGCGAGLFSFLIFYGVIVSVARPYRAESKNPLSHAPNTATRTADISTCSQKNIPARSAGTRHLRIYVLNRVPYRLPLSTIRQPVSPRTTLLSRNHDQLFVARIARPLQLLRRREQLPSGVGTSEPRLSQKILVAVFKKYQLRRYHRRAAFNGVGKHHDRLLPRNILDHQASFIRHRHRV